MPEVARSRQPHWQSRTGQHRLARSAPQRLAEMRIRSVLATGLILLGATGCVTLWTYEKPGVDDAETRRDMDSCRESAKAPRVPRPLVFTGAAMTSAPYD